MEALKKLGFDGAVAMQDALGVPAASPATDGEGADATKRVRPGSRDTLQGTMVRQRNEVAKAFATRNVAQIPLLVTTEHSARGMDFKGVDAV